MPFLVQLTADAVRDLEEIYDYIERHDSPGGADYVLKRIEAVFANLSEQPQHRNHPKELLDMGIREYREVFFKPYQIIYRVTGDNVLVLMVADGRRNMRGLLERRLLWA